MLTLPLRLFVRWPRTLRLYQDAYRAVLVDEFQDVNPVQFRLLEGWLGDRRDLCVVGAPNQAIFGWNGAETLGRTLHGWRHIYEEDRESAVAMIRALFEGRERHATLLYRNYRKDGSVIWVEWHNSALRDKHGRVISILSLAQDVNTSSSGAQPSRAATWLRAWSTPAAAASQ